MTSDPSDAADEEPGSTSGRAGRDLPAAIAVGVVLLALIGAALFFERALFLIVVVAAIGLAVWELATALSTNRIRVPLPPLLVGCAVMIVGTYFGGMQVAMVVLALTFVAILGWRLPGGAHGYVRDVTAAVFTAVYLPFLATFVVLMLRPDDGHWRVLTFIVVTACSDIGGYAAGVLFGRHPMAPTISPKKSWEGVAGSVVLCTAAGVAAVTVLLDGAWWVGVLLGLVTVVTATMGDLGESMIKRDLGVKDMSSLLPGHGGLMDRLDSLLFTVAFTWMILHWLV
ncbi:MAG: phosphatidate cytidylyltransferase [Propionibacteriales bacterium]|nr:phosphatidate cytidylyltransferase [Propionibacteriales bacterium]